MATEWHGIVAEIMDAVEQRQTAGGAFGPVIGSAPRTDATAWSLIFLRAVGWKPEAVAAASIWLRAQQSTDGRVSLASDYPQAWWPTPLAIWAWLSDPEAATAREAACHFLLSHRGEVVGFHPGKINPALRGWNYIAGTFSWVEPTALAVAVLSRAGYREAAAVQEGLELLMDRQLPDGGWNYGNTIVFGNQLRPAPEYTGMALWALAGQVEPSLVQVSLGYLHRILPETLTPLALGWGILALAAWKVLPAAALTWLAIGWQRWRPCSYLDTAALSLMGLAAWHCRSLLEAPKEANLGR